MHAPFRSRSAASPAAQLVLWTVANLALGLLFFVLLLLDDRAARAAGL